jgi:hypothetical protein
MEITDECGTVSSRGAGSWYRRVLACKPVLSTPALALLTLQLGLHICERIYSAEPAVVYFSPLLESIRLRNSEG